MSQFSLLKKRRFAPFFVAQFLGAFNDNLMKNVLVVLVTFGVSTQSNLSTTTLVNLAAGLFILPFFLFSATAGQIADKFEKSGLIRKIKTAEILIMVIASVGFYASSPEFLLLVLFLMGTQSAFFGPVKYSILPQHLRERELVGGNALVETGTFLAILLGTLLGPIVQQQGNAVISICLVGVASLGWLASRAIPIAPAVARDLKINWNFFTETWRIVDSTRDNRTVFLSIMGISWFWFYGATFVAQMPIYAREVLGGDEAVFAILVATFSIGIGIGSLLCERLSGERIEIGLVPFGAFGMTVFAFDLGLVIPEGTNGDLLGLGEFLQQLTHLRILFDLLMIAVFGGFFIVPLYALIQTRSDPRRRARTIAANNILNAAFMVVAAGTAIGLLKSGLTISQLFLVIAVMNAAVALFIFKLVPEFLMRFIVWILIHTIYRLDTKALEHIPEKGGAVLVSNHVSFVDALIITAACRRPIRFVMYHKIFQIPILNFVFRTNRAIPIASRREDEDLMEKAFDEVAAGLKQGDLIGLFPEGMITQDGEMNTFRPGIERIIEQSAVPVIPVALRGLWGSFFSRKGGAAMTKPLRLLTRLFSSIQLVVGEPVAPQEVKAAELEKTVLSLRGDQK